MNEQIVRLIRTHIKISAVHLIHHECDMNRLFSSLVEAAVLERLLYVTNHFMVLGIGLLAEIIYFGDSVMMIPTMVSRLRRET